MGGMVGIASGLLGIGGGVLIVPFLYALMAGSGWSGLEVLPRHQAQLAHATSLALIVPTACSGLLSYARRGIVEWGSVGALGLSAAAAAFLGARVAVLLPSVVLKVGFGVFLLVMAWRLGRRGPRGAASGATSEEDPGASAEETGGLRPAGAIAGGGLVGFFSALLGVGGGVIAIPVLIHWARLDLKRVAAASLGVVTFAALSGSAGYALAGRGVQGLPPGSLGFVHLPLLAAMLPGAVLLAPLGARLNQTLPTPVLRRVFAVLLLLIGLQLVWTNGLALLGGAPS